MELMDGTLFLHFNYMTIKTTHHKTCPKYIIPKIQNSEVEKTAKNICPETKKIIQPKIRQQINN